MGCMRSTSPFSKSGIREDMQANPKRHASISVDEGSGLQYQLRDLCLRLPETSMVLRGLPDVKLEISTSIC